MRFDSYHPVINALYFAAAFLCMVNFNHPLYVIIVFAAGALWLQKLKGIRMVIWEIVLVVLAGGFGLYYASYHHFGVTNLYVNFIGNHITLESLLYGLMLGLKIAGIVEMFQCLLVIFSTDRFVYLLGRLSPRLSLAFVLVLRFFPRLTLKARYISLARQGIGKGSRQGSPVEWARHIAASASILITWSMEDLLESTVSMKNRGYTLRGRTAYSQYLFDRRDRRMLLTMTLLLTMVWAGWMFDQTNISYDPAIVCNEMTGMSVIFAGDFALFMLLPYLLQVWAERRFQRQVERHEEMTL